MRLSKYTLTDKLSADKTLVIGTLNSSVVVLPDDFVERLRGEAFTTSNREEQGWVEELVKMGIVVSDDGDNRALVRSTFRTALLQLGRNMSLSLIPTLDCNLACPYCYEDAQRRPGIMSSDVLEASLRFLKESLKRIQPLSFNMHLYGGEPLLYPDLALTLSEQVSAILKQTPSIEYGFHITTNGTLAVPELMDQLEQVTRIPNRSRLTAQVTLDGPIAIHNRRRQTRDGQGTYEAITDYVRNWVDAWETSIRVNLDAETMPHVGALACELAEIPWRRKPSLYFSPTQTCNLDHDAKCLGVNAWSNSLDEAWTAAAYYGWESAHHLRYGLCSYHSGTVFLVDPEGSIYNCQAFVGDRELAVGCVLEDEPLSLVHVRQTNSNLWEECWDTCPVVPYCAGGCRSYAYFESGDIRHLYCIKDTLEQSAKTYFRFKHRAAISAFCSKDAVETPV